MTVSRYAKVWVAASLAVIAALTAAGVVLALASDSEEAGEKPSLFGFAKKADLIAFRDHTCGRNARAAMFDVVTRGNALAAQKLMASEDPPRQALVAFAIARTALWVAAAEAGEHRNALVLLWADADGRLHHIRYPFDPEMYATSAGGGVFQRWDEIGPEALAALGGEEREGLIYVDGAKYGGWPERVGVPPGEVACGLGYADGTYSNFVPLVREFTAPTSPPANAGGPGH